MYANNVFHKVTLNHVASNSYCVEVNC